MNIRSSAVCVVLACAGAPCAARCAEVTHPFLARAAFAITEAPAPVPMPAEPRAREPYALASDLAPSVLHGAKEVPELWLAQRSIDREWGPSDDSTYRTVDVKGWKSEGWAMVMSATVPGTGQLYVGESSGWLFLLGEALGWTGHYLVHDRAESLSHDAANYVGDPTDPNSTWSFARYEAATGAPATQLQTLWNHDRDAYYQALATSTQYNAGFSGPDPEATHVTYQGIRSSSQDRFQQVHYFDVALMLNHVFAAFDALRAARAHNLPLEKNLDLQLKANLNKAGPELHAVLTRRF